MRERAGSVPEISFFPTEISVSGLEILPYEDFRPVTEIKEFWWSGWHRLALPAVFSTSRASHLTAVIQLEELISEAMIGTKVKIFVFLHVALFPNLAPELVPRIFGLFSLGTKGKIRPGNRASLVNQAHVKRPLTL